MLGLCGVIRLPKAIEYQSQGCRFDALSRIGYADVDVRIYPLHADLNFPAVRGELDGIADQVPDHLLKPPWITDHTANARIDQLLKQDEFCLRRRPHAFDPRLDHFGQIDELNVETHSSAFYPGNVEQVVDQLSLSSGRPFDGGQSSTSIFAERQVTK